MQRDLPTGWSVRPLEKVATLQRGFDLPIQVREEGEIPVYGSNGIDGWHSHSAVSGPGVITGRSGTIGSVYLEPRDYWPLNTTLYVRDFHGNDPRFVARMLESLDLRRFAASTGVPSLNRNFVHPTPVLLPPLDEQSRIAVVLDTVDEAIAKTEVAIAKLKQMRAGLLHDLLTRGLDENGQLHDPVAHPEQFQGSLLGQSPREWDVVRVGALADFINGNAFDISEWAQQGLPIIRIQNLNGEQIFNYYDGPLDPRWHIVPGELLFAWSGTRETSFGPRIWTGPPAVLNQHIFKVVENQSRVSKPFLHLLLRQNLERIAKSAHGFKDSFVHITREELTGVDVALPKPWEQKRIVSLVEAYDQLVTSEECGLTKLYSLKSGLMSDLLTGRVRVPEEIAVAS
jgi:type I restriction enzyme, S subunit